MAESATAAKTSAELESLRVIRNGERAKGTFSVSEMEARLGDHREIGEPAESGNDIFGDAVAEIILGRITAQINEGQYRNRRAVSRNPAQPVPVQ